MDFQIKDEHVESYYAKKIREKYKLLILSIFLALICTLITRPGILYSDSYARIEYAKQILENKSMIYAWNTHVPSYFIAFSLQLTKGIELYTFFQAFLFFLITLLFVDRLGKRHKVLKMFIVCINPLIWGASVYYEAGIGCITGIIALILIISTINEKKNTSDKLTEFILLNFFSFIAFGYRANAFTVIPILIIYLFFTKGKAKQKIICVFAMTTGILMISCMAKLHNINTMSSKSAGFVWDVLNLINNLDLSDREEYMNIFDDLGGQGATRNAFELNNQQSIDGFIWDSRLNTEVLSEKGAFEKIIKKYIFLLSKEPKAFAVTKMQSVLKTLGIDKKLMFREYDYNRWDRMKEFGFSDTILRKLFVETYIIFNKLFSWYTLRPFVVFLISAIFLLKEYADKNTNFKFYLLFFLLALFYYGAFFINTQSYEIRYFFPTLYVLTIINVSMLFDFLDGDIHCKKKNRCNKLADNV